MDTKTKDTTEESGVVALLEQHKAENTGFDDTTLPETGVTATWPKFQPHSVWTKAQRLSKKNPFGTADNYVALLCRFNGEKLTIEEFKRLIPNGDILHLIGEVMGEDEDEEDLGNDQA